MSGNAITGTVYLLHFDRPYQHARHCCSGRPTSPNDWPSTRRDGARDCSR